jgi:hypothetical protein
MRKISSFAALAIIGLAAAEMASSYFLFRYYAHIRKELLPNGSAVWMLLKGGINKARGKHPAPVLSIDHGRLFDADESLGISLRPGRYRIKEQLGPKRHEFVITITDKGMRATSYFPGQSDRRLFMAGDSSMFGWALNDEQTIPWLTQARLPNFEVLNLSLTSYSPVQTLLRLQQLAPRLGPNDIVVVEYHELSNKLSVVPSDVIETLKTGYEFAVGDTTRMREANLPYGSLDDQGKFSIRRVSLSCAFEAARPDCLRPKFDPGQAMRVTNYAFDEIMALHPGHLVIIFQSGADDDPVIEHLRSRGAIIADLRNGRGPGEEDDVISTDGHMGPFGQYQIAERLFEVMQREHILN